MENKYYIAVDFNSEGWELREYKNLKEVSEAIQNGYVTGKFKIFKELRLDIVEPEENINELAERLAEEMAELKHV